MKYIKSYIFYLIICLAITEKAFTAVVTSIASGTFSTTTTWDCTCNPANTDTIIILNGDTVTIAANRVMGKLTINSGGVLLQSSTFASRIDGDYTNNGLHSTAGGNIILNGVNSIIDGSGTITVGGSARLQVQGGNKTIASSANLTQTSGNFRINNTFAVTNNGTYSLTANINVASGSATWTNAANSTLNIGGDFTGTLTVNANAGGNTVNYNGTSAAQTGLGITYHNLHVSRAAINEVSFSSGTLTVNNNLVINSGIMDVGGISVTVSDTTDITGSLEISSATGTRTFNDIIINTGGTWRLLVDETIEVNGSLTNDGTFIQGNGGGTNIYNFNGDGKTIGGDNALTIANINITNGGYTNTGTISNTTNLYIDAFGQFTQGSNSSLSIGGTFTDDGVHDFSSNTNTVEYNATGNQSVDNSTYHHLTISGTGTKSISATLNINGNLIISTINDTLDANNSSINIGGNWTNTGLYKQGTSGGVTFNGTGTQTITNTNGGETFRDISVSGTSNTVALSGTLTATRNLTISNNCTLDVGSNNPITIGRDWTNNGTFLQKQGTVTFNGSVTGQLLSGTSTTTFYNLVLNNTSGGNITLGGGTVFQVENLLTLTAGIFDVSGATSFTLLSTAGGTAQVNAGSGGTGTITGNVTVQRYISGSSGYRYMACPVASQTYANWEDDFSIPSYGGTYGNAYVYRVDETVLGASDSGWVSVSSNTQSIAPGFGFANYIYNTDLPTTVDVTGSVSFSNVNFNLTYTTSDSGVNHDGWSLIGNPYPSTINWSTSSGWTRANVDSAVYIWRPDLGQYASWVSGTPTNGGSNLIAPSQAFFVHANAASPSLIVKRAATGSSAATFFKTSENSIPSVLGIQQKKGANLVDETVVKFQEGASSDFDGSYDAYKILNTIGNPNLYTMSGNTRYSINSLNPLTGGSISVPLYVKVTTNDTFHFDFDLKDFDEKVCIILEDTKLNQSFDLKTINHYSFASDITDGLRFILHFNKVLADFTIASDSVYLINGIATVDFINNSLLADDFTWYYGDNTSGSEASHTYSNEGVYEVMLVAHSDECGGSNDTTYQEVYILKQDVSSLVNTPLSELITIYPNPVKNELNVSNQFAQVEPIQKIKLINVLGQKVIEITNIKVQDRLSINVSKIPSGIYTVEIYTPSETLQYKIYKN